jgi:hypothetical protein
MDTEKIYCGRIKKEIRSQDTPFPEVCPNFRKNTLIKEEFVRSSG